MASTQQPKKRSPRTDSEFPKVPAHIVRALRERFPTMKPTSGASLRDYDVAYGVEKVLTFLDSECAKTRSTNKYT